MQGDRGDDAVARRGHDDGVVETGDLGDVLAAFDGIAFGHEDLRDGRLAPGLEDGHRGRQADARQRWPLGEIVAFLALTDGLDGLPRVVSRAHGRGLGLGQGEQARQRASVPVRRGQAHGREDDELVAVPEKIIHPLDDLRVLPIHQGGEGFPAHLSARAVERGQEHVVAERRRQLRRRHDQRERDADVGTFV